MSAIEDVIERVEFGARLRAPSVGSEIDFQTVDKARQEHRALLDATSKYEEHMRTCNGFPVHVNEHPARRLLGEP